MLIFLCGFLAAALAAGWACRQTYRKQELILYTLAVLFPLSEIWKQLLLTWANGGAYRWWYFPFQLCSMPLYLLPLRQLLVLRLKSCPEGLTGTGKPASRRNYRFQRVPFFSWLIAVLTDFLADFGLLAGLFAFADQTGMRYEIPGLTLHSYLWHFTMIFLGLFLILSGRPNPEPLPLSSGREENGGENPRNHSGFLPAVVLFFILAGAAEILNFLLRGRGHIDLFYISPWEPAVQVVLRDVAARVGRGAEIIVYLCLVTAGAGLLHLSSPALRRAFQRASRS